MLHSRGRKKDEVVQMYHKDKILLDKMRRQSADSLGCSFDVTKPVALLDVPIHTNIGDLMIYAGERAYLDQLGVEVAYISDVRRFDPEILRRRMPEGTVLIHGGGNLGDIWPEHQNFKELAATVLRDYPMVQLPQTMYFESKENAARAHEVFASHPDYTLMLRDTASIDRASLYFPGIESKFVYDMALGWTPELRRRETSHDLHTVILAREDKEAASEISSLAKSELTSHDQVIDWTLNRRELTLYWLGRIPTRISNGRAEKLKRRALYPLMEASFGLTTEANLRAGVRSFSDADVVATDRLHAHILATLMGIPNIAMDNNYGKVKAIFGDYTSQFTTSYFAENGEELTTLLRNLKGADNARP